MKFMFPYRLIQKGSKVAMYGGGAVGKEFYYQILHSGYCELTVWVDKIFRGFSYNRRLTEWRT